MSTLRFARLFVVGLMALCALVPSSIAFANSPSREPVPFTTLYRTGECSFDLKVEALFNKAQVTTFYDRAGNVRFELFTGAMKLRFTNLSTGKTLDTNNNALVRVVSNADGTTTVTFTGPWAGDQLSGAVPGFPPVWIFHGKAVLTIDATGNVSVIHTPSPVIDVCAALAG